jgi:hypothetical protein
MINTSQLLCSSMQVRGVFALVLAKTTICIAGAWRNLRGEIPCLTWIAGLDNTKLVTWGKI